MGEFKVWTKRFGTNPKLKSYCFTVVPQWPTNTWNVLKLFSKRGFEFYEYDQLGSYYSDQPKDSSLWTTERFVEEVEQVRSHWRR
jgi:proline iminopeptidase